MEVRLKEGFGELVGKVENGVVVSAYFQNALGQIQGVTQRDIERLQSAIT